jgi:hypothetical protein
MIIKKCSSLIPVRRFEWLVHSFQVVLHRVPPSTYTCSLTSCSLRPERNIIFSIYIYNLFFQGQETSSPTKLVVLGQAYFFPVLLSSLSISLKMHFFLCFSHSSLTAKYKQSLMRGIPLV